jgi:hypothetical protein
MKLRMHRFRVSTAWLLGLLAVKHSSTNKHRQQVPPKDDVLLRDVLCTIGYPSCIHEG